MKNIIVQSGISIRQAMKNLSESGKKCLVIANDENMLLGTLSDGDLRKAILNGTRMGESIKSIYQKNPTVLIKDKYSISKAKKLFLKHNFDLIPIVNENGVLEDILLLESILKNGDNKQKNKLDVPVVIMAGGRGERMEPFTKILPKPLIPVHEKPVIEHIIERFTALGMNDFYITVNYKSRIMKAFFEELDPGYSVTFVTEEKPLGTAGSLKYLVDDLESSFFVTNCDTIINADLFTLYQNHKSGKYDITIVASAKEYVIPFGACKLNKNGGLDSIIEKPRFDFLINTGLYIINPEVLSLIPKERVFHTTDLIQAAKKNNMEIGVYPIDEDSWIDVGQWAEYQKAVEKL